MSKYKMFYLSHFLKTKLYHISFKELMIYNEMVDSFGPRS